MYYRKTENKKQNFRNIILSPSSSLCSAGHIKKKCTQFFATENVSLELNISTTHKYAPESNQLFQLI